MRPPTSKFDPRAVSSPTGYVDPYARAQQLESDFERDPGRRPGGSGTTGLGRHDEFGYRKMLEDQQDYLQLRALLGDREPEFGVRYGGTMPSPRMTPGTDPAEQAVKALRGRR